MKTTHLVILLIVATVLGVVGLAAYSINQPGPYDDFAACIAEEGDITFYGAYWCQACNQQKALFGRSSKLLPYVECYENGSQEISQTCLDNEIESFPTWIKGSGDRTTGVKSFEELSELTGCELPA